MRHNSRNMRNELNARLDGFEPVFASYVASLPHSRGKPDYQVRAPQVFGQVWRELGLVPPRARVVLVSGSKGKGTAARLIAWNLQAQGARVGLVVSPEEINHLDRIRIDNMPIDEVAFSAHLADVLAPLQALLGEQPPGSYLSPTGIFLSVALSWFARQRVDWYVIEGGRGVMADEIGQIKAGLGVLTTVLPEHVAALGGSFEHVLRDKLGLLQLADVVVAGPQVLQCMQAMEIAPSENLVFASAQTAPASTEPMQDRYPQWYAQLCLIAGHALRVCGSGAAFRAYATPSFWHGNFETRAVVCEPVVSGDSIDLAFLARQFPQGAGVLIGLSDDKDTGSVLARLRDAGFGRLCAVRLSSGARHVSSDWIDTQGVHELGQIDVVHPDLCAVRDMLRTFPGPVYVVGVQVFIRCVRLALGVKLMEAMNGP